MLTIFDLYDLHAVFTNIRNNSDYILNKEIIEQILNVVQSKNQNGISNPFRHALQNVKNLDKELYSFVYIINYYTYIPFFIKDETVYRILEKLCNELLNAINTKNFEMIQDLADLMHNIPIILIEHNFSIPKSFWNLDVQLYRKKWNNNFLYEFEKK